MLPQRQYHSKQSVYFQLHLLQRLRDLSQLDLGDAIVDLSVEESRQISFFGIQIFVQDTCHKQYIHVREHPVI